MRLGLASWEGHGGQQSPAEIPPTDALSGHFQAPAAEQLAPLFPQLEIVKLVGQGGMGAVYKAKQTSLDRLVALKIIKPDAADDPHFAERFAREAKALARLSHSNIVTVHDFGQVVSPDPIHRVEEKRTEPDRTNTAAANTLYYLIMELVDGLNLRQMLDAQTLEPAEALRIVPAICDALQYAHDQGVVHRDIKPENVLIDKQGRVKIADFGLAKLVRGGVAEQTLTGSHQVMGTLRYMAPEQLEGSHDVDHRADIYSLGVVFYEMLTGELPIGRFAPPSQKVQVDVRLDEVVLRTLEKEPQRRYQQASDVKTDLQTIEQTGPETDVSKSTKPTSDELGSVRRDQTFRLDQLYARFWYGSTGLLLAGWVAIAAAWNFRHVIPAVLGMAGILGFVARWCARYSPVVSQYRRTETWTTCTVTFIGMLFFYAFGVYILVGAYHRVWELRCWPSSADSMESFEARYEGKEHQLIRRLDTFKESVPLSSLRPIPFLGRWPFISDWLNPAHIIGPIANGS